MKYIFTTADKDEALNIMRIDNICSAIHEFFMELRRKHKYEHGFKTADEAVDWAYSMLHKCFGEQNLDLWEV